MTVKKKRMAIIASYFTGENYGLLGPQMAAAVIEENTPYACIVIAVDRKDDKAILKKSLAEYFGTQRSIIGFSTLSGREDLFLLARELKDEGALTILAGPQADVDFLGETGWQEHPYRFHGLSEHFSFALHGPVEQMVPFLQDPVPGGIEKCRGALYRNERGRITRNPEKTWEEAFLSRVRWDNLYRPGERGLAPHGVYVAQVLQHIGCPHASRPKEVEVDYPAFLVKEGPPKKVTASLCGCSFCDVAADKGFHGSLSLECVIRQIQGLPELEDGRKIPFELINENPLPGLPSLLKEVHSRNLSLSQINLTLRTDWFVLGEKSLREALHMARQMRIKFLLSSAGFESFDDRILRNLNKGLDVETNLRAIRTMRRLKQEFPFQWSYSRDEGASHGFIHPTPWDTPESAANIQRVLDMTHLASDILPRHSVPLIIHHASGLADWVREIEARERIRFERYVSAIGWWEESLLESRKEKR
jgi:hypothetical protein